MKACKPFMPKYLSQITLVRATDGVALPPNPLEGVVLSSTSTSWQSLVVEEHHWSSGSCEVNEDVKYLQHVITVNIGRSVTAQYRKDGRFRHVTKPKGAISLFPSQRPFFRRVGVARMVHQISYIWRLTRFSSAGLRRTWSSILI